MSLTDVVGPELVGKDGVKVDTNTLKDLDQLGIYFSAHWCPPCRGFTPKLVATYNKLKAEGKKFEIIFVSFDRDEKSYEDYYAEMPWLSLPFDSDKKDSLGSDFGVSGIPCFAIVDPSTGKLLNKEGRGLIDSDPEGNNFPWCK